MKTNYDYSNPHHPLLVIKQLYETASASSTINSPKSYEEILKMIRNELTDEE